MKKTIYGLLIFGGTAIALTGCGGNGSTGSSGDASSALVVQTGQGTGVQTADYIIPATSIEQPSDIGLRAHTNFVISTRSTSSGIGIANASTPSGFFPANIRGAYGVPSTGGSGAVAIVDAYNDPTALNDFNVYAGQFGLPKETSTNATSSSNTVFQVVYASGSQPATDGGWAEEESLDFEMAHAMAPSAKVFLVEAASTSYVDLMNAVNVAKTLPGVKEVSMSFGGTEASSLYTSYNNNFVQSGVAFFASGGDTGGERSFPALSVNIVAVGGTSLTMSGTTYVSEKAWSSTGCGLSSFQSRPTFQNGVSGVVGTKRGGDDLSAVADPNTGVAVYDSTSYQGFVGWLVFGGTSVSCPLCAGMANNANTGRASSQAQNTAIYAKLGTASFHDVTTGSAGGHRAAAGYDLPTGVGSPKGLSGF